MARKHYFFLTRKNLIALFLIGSLLAPFAGTYFYLHLKRSSLRRELKWELANRLDKESLVLLTFARTDSASIHWKHDKEFEHKGLMFDIVHRSSQGDSLLYWCWPDHQETQLNKQLDRLFTDALHHNPWRNKRKTELFNFLKKWKNTEALAINAFFTKTTSTPSFILSPFLDRLSEAPPSPPPRLVV